MKKQTMMSSLVLSMLVCGLAPVSHAGSFTDNFNVNRDYKAQGVVGTLWGGITAGTKTPSTVASWNANISSPGTLTITNAGGQWRNTGDGPLLWALVKGAGDFTNTVHVSDMSQANYNMSGLIVRDPATTNENYVMLALFAEFNIALVYRDTINGSDSDVSYTPSYHSDTDKTTWVSWLRIVRAGGVISLSASRDNVAWEDVYTSTRTDLTGDLEVGIMNSTYTDNQCWANYQNFSLTGPGINAATPPAQAAGLSLTPGVGSVKAAWTSGAGSAGSVVVVRRSNPITRQPVDGTTYTGDAGLSNGSDLGESNYVAYAGSGSQVTLTNLTATVPYTVAVYSYSRTGTSTVYALSNAPSATAAPYGTPTGITLSFTSTNAVAADDTIQAVVKVQFVGGAEVDVTSSATYGSSDANLATASASGLIAGLSAGVVRIAANYQTFSASSNLTVVKLPVTDDFSTPKNYLTEGIAGTPWHGLLLGASDVPLGNVTFGTGPGKTLVADASETKAGRLTVQSTDTGFDASEDDGFFLYRVIPGDFSIAVQVTSFNNLAYHMPGLMARAPFEFASLENSLAIVGFNEFSIGNFVRVVTSGIKSEVAQQAMPAMPFLKLVRQTNTFNFYQKLHALDSWTLIYTQERPDLEGVAMQVGIVDQIFTANTGTAEFDNLTITGSTVNSSNAPSAPSNLLLSSTVKGKVSATWTAGPGSSGSILIAHPSIPATRQPADGADYSATANADLDVGYDIGGSNIVLYAGAGNSVVASNLPPYHYTFAVYSYAKVGNTNYYNILSPATSAIDVAGIPVIDPQPPAAITRYSGEAISMVAGSSPATYIWQKNQTNLANGDRISGATTTSLSINNSQAGDSGMYRLIATTTVGSTTSSPTVLTILSPTNAAELSVLADNPSAFWRMEESSGTIAFDYAGGYDGTHGAGDTLGVPGPRASDGYAQFAAGNLAAQFPGNAGATALSIPSLTSGTETVSALTITTWIQVAAFPPDRAGLVTFLAPADTGLRVYNGANGLSILWNNTVSHSGIIPPLGQWAFVAMVISPTSGKVYMATKGNWLVYGDTTPRTPISLSGGGYIGSDRAIADRYFEGVMDEVAVYRAALSGSAITNLYNGVVPPPDVTINIQKIGSSVQVSWPQGTLLESPQATGPWTTNSSPSPLIITNPADNKFYRVLVR